MEVEKEKMTEYKKESGLKFERYFSKAGDPYKTIEWEKRDATIRNDEGDIVEELKGVEVPKSWSKNALDTTASKYLKKEVPKIGRETSVAQLIKRVSDTITDWGLEQGYFNENNAKNFRDELSYLCLNQYGLFNSPVEFNLGLWHKYGISHSTETYHINPKTGIAEIGKNLYENPLISACFISSPEDSIESMIDIGSVISSRIFKNGAGIGGDWSAIRSAGESVSGGGIASGAKRFMDIQDSAARVIKSGGKNRRAATMQTISVHHPDTLEIIKSKYIMDKNGRILVEAGAPSKWEDPTWQDLRGQNVNISLRLTDEFIKAVENNGTHYFREVLNGKVRRELPAKDMLEMIAFAAHQCGDPGVQYHNEINRWNTCPNSGTINSSNPCSEFMFLDNTACNLASLRLTKFKKEDGTFDLESFKKAVDIFVTAQDIFISKASYPTKKIAENCHIFRPIGLGYTDLGALILENGLAYDSDEARNFAAAITANMTSEAYLQSTKLAKLLGPFQEFEKNKEPMLKIMEKHKEVVSKIKINKEILNLEGLVRSAVETWGETIENMQKYGARNAQATLLAPAGTIAYPMDCKTTGCEPFYAHIIQKELAGGGLMTIINDIIPTALKTLRYNENDIKEITDYVNKNGTLEGCKTLKEKHLSVFDCANTPEKGTRTISSMGHVKMLAAIQGNLSGGISKTINLPRNATVEDIEEIIKEGSKLGVKSLAIYRDGAKGAQPLKTIDTKKIYSLKRGEREKLPSARLGLTQKVKIGQNSIFLRTGEYKDGRLGELFIDCLERGSEINRLLNEIAIEFSEKLQYGVPLEEALEIFGKSGQSQLAGITDHPFIKISRGIEGFTYDWASAHYLGNISSVPKDPEMRPLPQELRVYQLVPKLHLLPTVAGEKFYTGVPSLEETVKKISETNYWCDTEEGLDTRKTIEKIIKTRKWKIDSTDLVTIYADDDGKIRGQVCSKGHAMINDGNCWKCPVCKTSTGGCGGG